MSNIWNFTKKISEYLTASTNSSKDEKNFNTISTEDKGRIRKSKTVTFGEIETIDVESYKKYNEDGISLENEEVGCMKKCGLYCKWTFF